MEELKLKMKCGAEFAITFDTMQELIEFLVEYEKRKETDAPDTFIGARYGN